MEAKELRENLYEAAKQPVRAVVGGEFSTITVHVNDRFGEDAFEVKIEPAPKPQAMSLGACRST